MIKNEIELKNDFDKCVELIDKIDRLKSIYDGWASICRDWSKEDGTGLWKYNYCRGKELNLDEIKVDFAECFNDLIIDYVNEENNESSGK